MDIAVRAPALRDRRIGSSMIEGDLTWYLNANGQESESVKYVELLSFSTVNLSGSSTPAGNPVASPHGLREKLDAFRHALDLSLFGRYTTPRASSRMISACFCIGARQTATRRERHPPQSAES